jgi:hypothetical protein
MEYAINQQQACLLHEINRIIRLECKKSFFFQNKNEIRRHLILVKNIGLDRMAKTSESA